MSIIFSGYREKGQQILDVVLLIENVVVEEVRTKKEGLVFKVDFDF